MYHTYPSLRIARGPRRLVGGDRITARSRPWRPTRSAVRCASNCRGGASTTRPAGNAGVEPRVSLIYTETVEKRGTRLRFRRAHLDQRGEKSWRLYPAKGALAVGSRHATSLLLDVAPKRHIVARRRVHEPDIIPPWEGTRPPPPAVTITHAAHRTDCRNGALTGALHRRQFP